MSTTFEVYANQRVGNYCTRPSKDVEILPDVRVCASCRTLLEPVPLPKGASWGIQSWKHAEPTACESTYIRAADRCRYCHSQDAKYRQHAWHDAVECDRCGGIDGYAIGD